MEAPIISSEQITLRVITLSDLKEIHKLHLLPETDAFNTLGIPSSIQETQAIITPWINDNTAVVIKNYTFAITTHQDQQFIGLYGLKLSNSKYSKGEIWYKIHKDYWNNGYATEATQAMLDFCFDTLHLHRVEAGCAVQNIGSYKVLEKVGMTREGRGRQKLPLRTGWTDNYEYAILKSDPRRS